MKEAGHQGQSGRNDLGGADAPRLERTCRPPIDPRRAASLRRSTDDQKTGMVWARPRMTRWSARRRDRRRCPRHRARSSGPNRPYQPLRDPRARFSDEDACSAPSRRVSHHDRQCKGCPGGRPGRRAAYLCRAPWLARRANAAGGPREGRLTHETTVAGGPMGRAKGRASRCGGASTKAAVARAAASAGTARRTRCGASSWSSRSRATGWGGGGRAARSLSPSSWLESCPRGFKG